MCQQTVTRAGQTVAAAHGVVTVCSADRTECHAASGFDVKCFSGSNGARDRQTAMVLDYWQACGILRTSCPRNASCPSFAANGRCDLGGMHVRDLVNADLAGNWYPLAARDAAGRADRAELSHVRSAQRGGCYCACNLLPENGARNAARGDLDMTRGDMTAEGARVLGGWPAYWRATVARKASHARIGA
jgi:hypothetical protein